MHTVKTSPAEAMGTHYVMLCVLVNKKGMMISFQNAVQVGEEKMIQIDSRRLIQVFLKFMSNVAAHLFFSM